MARARQGKGTWPKTTVQLVRTAATVVIGPRDVWIVVYGQRAAGGKVSRQSERKRTTKGGQ